MADKKRGSLKNLASARQLQAAGVLGIIISTYMLWKGDMRGLWFFIIGMLTIIWSKYRK